MRVIGPAVERDEFLSMAPHNTGHVFLQLLPPRFTDCASATGDGEDNVQINSAVGICHGRGSYMPLLTELGPGTATRAIDMARLRR